MHEIRGVHKYFYGHYVYIVRYLCIIMNIKGIIQCKNEYTEKPARTLGAGRFFNLLNYAGEEAALRGLNNENAVILRDLVALLRVLNQKAHGIYLFDIRGEEKILPSVDL